MPRSAPDSVWSLEKIQAQGNQAHWFSRVQDEARDFLGVAAPPALWLPNHVRSSPIPDLALVLQTCIDVEFDLLANRDPLIQYIAGKPRSVVADAVKEAIDASPGAPFEL